MVLERIQSVERWDEWFEGTKDEESIRTWKAAKTVFTDLVRLNAWAYIIESNRLDKPAEPQEK